MPICLEAHKICTWHMFLPKHTTRGGGGGERVEGLNFRLENLARLNCIWPKKKKRINKNLHNCARNYFSISHAIIEKQKTS